MENLIKYAASVISLKNNSVKDGDNYYADSRTCMDNLLDMQVSIEKSNNNCLFCVFDDIKEIDDEGRQQVTLVGEVKKLHDRMCKIDRNIETKLNMMRECIRDTDNLLYSAALGRPANRKGATAFAGLVFTEQKAAAYNIGGNRVYLFRSGILKQMTGDSSKMEKLLKMGIITLEQARNISPHFGSSKDGKRDESSAFEIDDVRTGDVFVILSGWLANALEDERLSAILSEETNADRLAARLVDEAAKSNCSESVTAMVINIEEGCEEKAEKQPRKQKRISGSETSPTMYLPVEKKAGENTRTYVAAVAASIFIIAILFCSYLIWFHGGTGNGKDQSDTFAQDSGFSNETDTSTTTEKTETMKENTSNNNESTGNKIKNGEKTTYIVKSGDSLSSISQKFYQDVNRYKDIMEANSINDENSLTVGQELIIP